MSARKAYDRRLTPYQEKRIIELKRQGLSTGVVSQRLGVPSWRIQYLLRKEKKK